MTALLLNCGSRKELVACFHAANPRTECDLERLHKWLQGRSVPRAASVLDDWALVLGCERSGTWLAGCTLADFAAEMATLFGREAQELLAAQPFAGRGGRTAQPGAAAEPSWSGERYLCGHFACYSLSWSPYTRGKVIRGGLAISPGRGGALSVVYAETIFGRAVRLAGEAIVGQGSLHLPLLEAGGNLPMFFSLFLPRPPAGALCGMISGVNPFGGELEPSASRIVAVRVPDAKILAGTHSYLEREPGVLAGDLAALGLRLPDPERIDALLRAFLAADGRPYQVSAAEQAAFSAELDPLHLASTLAAQ